MPIEPTWTEQRIALLIGRFEAGLSCAEIAADIGVSRNAVIGKISRLGLSRIKSNDARGGKREAPKARRPRLAYPYPAPRAVPDAATHAVADVLGSDNCSLLELSPDRCRWPINTPGTADFCYCGNKSVDGLPYCTGHARIAYRPGSRQGARA